MNTVLAKNLIDFQLGWVEDFEGHNIWYLFNVCVIYVLWELNTFCGLSFLGCFHTYFACKNLVWPKEVVSVQITLNSGSVG